MAEAQKTEPTEREILLGIYSAVSTIRNLVLLSFLAGIAAAVIVLASR